MENILSRDGKIICVENQCRCSVLKKKKKRWNGAVQALALIIILPLISIIPLQYTKNTPYETDASEKDRVKTLVMFCDVSF